MDQLKFFKYPYLIKLSSIISATNTILNTNILNFYYNFLEFVFTQYVCFHEGAKVFLFLKRMNHVKEEPREVQTHWLWHQFPS